MYSYILILVLVTPTNTTVESPPHDFTKERCEAAAKVWEQKLTTKLSTAVGVCLPRG